MVWCLPDGTAGSTHTDASGVVQTRHVAGDGALRDIVADPDGAARSTWRELDGTRAVRTSG